MAQVYSYKCPNCTAALRYDSERDILKCDFCDSEFEVSLMQDYSNAAEHEQTAEQTSADFGEYCGSEWENISLNICPNCAAEIVTDETTAVTKCPYCSNTAFIKKNLSGAFRPDAVIPFKISRDEALEALKEFSAGKPLLPKNFIKDIDLEGTQGLYVPFWLYDCQSDGRITYNATRVSTWQDSRYIYTKTSHYFVERDGQMRFVRIPSDASKKMNDSIMEAIEPYDYSQLCDFDSGYLSGYVADKYDVSSDENKKRVCERVLASVRAEYLRTVIGYSSVVRRSEDIKISDTSVRYALFPVWVLDYTYAGQRYTYTVNGQTGKVAGKLPVSKKRFAAWLGGLTGILGLIFGLLICFM